MDRMTMGVHAGRKNFAARLGAALREGEIEEDDTGIIVTAILVGSALGGVIGYVSVELMTYLNAVSLGLI